jgi:2'-5' RNA ligase
MQKENLYFIATIPPKEICDEIEIFKRDFAERFGAKEALKNVAHITMKAPFKLPAGQYDYLLQWFDNLSIEESPFGLRLKDFGCFIDNLVIFIKPEPNILLTTLQKSIIRQFVSAFPNIKVSRLELTFHPHITVAYRDLTAGKFADAWSEYRNKKYAASYTMNEFCLLQHNGKKWNIIRTREMLN